MSNFVAIDFETADYEADSACAIGMVKVRNGRVVAKYSRLIRPPRRNFIFSYLHGIRWSDVKDEPDFGTVWSELAEHVEDVDYLLAHNARFDRGVLEACCYRHDFELPEAPFVCTVKLARAIWNIRPTKLPDVCRSLDIELTRHHDAIADALACAHIGRIALKQGHLLDHGLLGRGYLRRYA
jgi:DNA polymerase-3 subunit epsilon